MHRREIPIRIPLTRHHALEAMCGLPHLHIKKRVDYGIRTLPAYSYIVRLMAMFVFWGSISFLIVSGVRLVYVLLYSLYHIVRIPVRFCCCHFIVTTNWSENICEY